MKKRIISITLALIFVLSACGSNQNTPHTSDTPTETLPEALEEPTITRAQWIRLLTDTMGYGKTSYAEAYFADVQADNAAYDSVQIAVAYNLLDQDAERFRPDENATREFVAVTAVKAVGLNGEPEAELLDISGSQGADSIRLAVDSGFFSCPDGSFNPRGSVTVTQAGEILKRVESFFRIDVVPSHVDTVEYREGVIDLSNAFVTYDDPSAMSVRVSGTNAVSLEVGSVYILPPSPEFPYGVARKVRTVAQDGTEYIIENEVPFLEEVVSKVDIQGVYYLPRNGICGHVEWLVK